MLHLNGRLLYERAELLNDGSKQSCQCVSACGQVGVSAAPQHVLHESGRSIICIVMVISLKPLPHLSMAGSIIATS